MKIQILCGDCSGRVVVEMADDANATQFMAALKTAVTAHAAIDTEAADAAEAERTPKKK